MSEKSELLFSSGVKSHFVKGWIINALIDVLGIIISIFFMALEFIRWQLALSVNIICILFLTYVLYRIKVHRKRSDFEIWTDRISFSENIPPTGRYTLKTKSFTLKISDIHHVEQDIDIFSIITHDGKIYEIPHLDLLMTKTDDILRTFKQLGLTIIQKE